MKSDKSANQASDSEYPFPFNQVWQLSNWDAISAQLFESWRRAIALGAKILEESAKGSAKMRSAQLEAGQQMQTKMLDFQKSMAAAKTPTDLWAIQINWALDNLNQSTRYWQKLIEAANEINLKIYSRAHEHA